MSVNAHLAVFTEQWSLDLERIDFALLTVDENDIPLQYVTIREKDSKTAYLQYGGSFPSVKGTVLSRKSFRAILDELDRTGYERVTFLVENTNKPMLKLALIEDFLITGVRIWDGSVLIEHLKEKKVEE